MASNLYMIRWCFKLYSLILKCISYLFLTGTNLLCDSHCMYYCATESCVLDVVSVLHCSGLYVHHVVFQTKDGLD